MHEISTVDYHTAGEPFRIVESPPIDLPGRTVAEKRAHAIESPEAQTLRRFLCHEPRGHADMYGGFIVAPDDAGADLGVLFWHKDGFSTACGHGTMALGVWAIESGMITADPSGTTEVTIDVPSGRVTARVQASAEGRPTGAEFVNVPSYVLHRQVPVETSAGRLHVDIAYSGALYAHIPAQDVGLTVTPENHRALVAVGREIKWALNATEFAVHPTDDRLSGIYGTILFDDLGTETRPGAPHQRNITVFADGEVDRSPCGSGTCSRVALLAASGMLAEGNTFIHDSLISTRFEASYTSGGMIAGHEAVIPTVSGMAHRTGTHAFTTSSGDPLATGFLI
ncbi:proline racemase family protein [Nesterenkonia halophila]